MEGTVKKVREALDKKALPPWRTNHDLHVLLIEKQNGLTRSQAVVQAYFEGVDGLKERLG